jgi:hypothetical protein
MNEGGQGIGDWVRSPRSFGLRASQLGPKALILVDALVTRSKAKAAKKLRTAYAQFVFDFGERAAREMWDAVTKRSRGRPRRSEPNLRRLARLSQLDLGYGNFAPSG